MENVACFLYVVFGLYYAGKTFKPDERKDPLQILIVMMLWPFFRGMAGGKD